MLYHWTTYTLKRSPHFRHLGVCMYVCVCARTTLLIRGHLRTSSLLPHAVLGYRTWAVKLGGKYILLVEPSHESKRFPSKYYFLRTWAGLLSLPLRLSFSWGSLPGLLFLNYGCLLQCPSWLACKYAGELPNTTNVVVLSSYKSTESQSEKTWL